LSKKKNETENKKMNKGKEKGQTKGEKKIGRGKIGPGIIHLSLRCVVA